MAAALALSTSLTYGLANYLGPRLARTTPLFIVLLIGQSWALVLAVALVVLRGGAVPDGAGFGLAVAAGLGNIGGLTFFYLAASTGPFSIVAPIVATSAILPVVVGLARGDAVTSVKLTGMMLALGGVVLVSRSPRESPAPRTGGSRTVMLSLLSALTTGAFLALLEPAAHRAGTDWTVLISRTTLLTGITVLAVCDGSIARARVPGVRWSVPRFALLALPGLLLFAGTLAFTSATQQGELSVVAVLAALHPLVTVGVAMALDRERLSRLRAAGIAAALVGVILLSL